MEWSKATLGKPTDPKAKTIYLIEGPEGDFPDGSFYTVGEQTGQWQVVQFDRGGGNRLVSRHESRETACQEAERLLAQAKAKRPSSDEPERGIE